jgi:sterol desaturase/sphingolipid hydroxylase (fatty acid hydroxylase superfamily)
MGVIALVVSQLISPFIIRLFERSNEILNQFSISKSQQSAWFIVLTSILLIDFINYLLHRMMHKKYFWNTHKVHHSDKAVCALTPLIHHPVEIIISTCFVLFFYFIFDIPLVVVLGYVLFFSLYDAFVHSNLILNKKLDSLLGLVFITPNLHRAHHSIDSEISNTNFGSLFSFWDRVFGTYKKIDSVKIFGLRERFTKRLNLINLLKIPFLH